MIQTRQTLVLLLAIISASNLHANSIAVSPSSDLTAQMTVINGVPTATSLLDDDDTLLRTFSVPDVWRSALEFSLVAIPAGSTINSASLRLVDIATQVPGTIQIHGYTGDGNVGFDDFAYDNLLTSYNTLSTSGVANPHLLDVTAFIQGKVSGSSSFAGFMLRLATEGIFSGADIASNENPDVNIRPLLTIDYSPASVPEVGRTLWLFGISCSALVFFKRRLGLPQRA